MGKRIFYGELGEIERICYREGCYWKTEGICMNNESMLQFGKKCRRDDLEKCKNWRKDEKWKDRKPY